MATVFVTVGAESITDIIDGTTTVPANYFAAQGTGAGTAVIGDTSLFVEASETRVQTTNSQPAASTNRFVATIVADGTKTITNAGLFTLITGGILWIKGDFTGIPVNASDSIEYTFELAHS
jgi:hypothetical protein